VLSLSASSCRAQNSSKSSDRGCAGQRYTLDPKPTLTQLPSIIHEVGCTLGTGFEHRQAAVAVSVLSLKAGSTGRPAARQASIPPANGRILVNPSLRNCLAIRAALASFGQAQ
jgi:hypothetical protein